MNGHTTAGALPWAGIPGVDVKVTLHRAPNGDVSGRLVMNRPGQEQVVIDAKDNEEAIYKRLLQRFKGQIATANASGAHAGWGFLKKLKKMAKKVVRGKIIGKLAKGFKSVMKIPVLGPALGVAVPALGATYLAMRGAEKLGISPWQANKMRREKNPRKRAAYARKIRARSRLVGRARWMRAMRRARGGRRGYARRRPSWRRQYRRRPRRQMWRGWGGRGRARFSGDGAIAEDAAIAGWNLLQKVKAGDPRAHRAVKCLIIRARRGDRRAILARKVLKECMKRKASGAPRRGHGLPTARGLSRGEEQPEEDLDALIVASGGDIEDVMEAAGVEDEDELLAVAGVDLELEQAPGDDVEDDAQAAAIAGAAAMDLNAGYYNILGGSAAYNAVAGYGDHAESPAGEAGVFYDIAGNPHTHHVHIPAQHIETTAAGMQLPMIVTGADGVPRRKSWNGLRWVWSELAPHAGIRSETQGFGMRDALLLGMKRIQSRELAG